MRNTLIPAFLFASALAITPALAQSSSQQGQKSQPGQQAQGSKSGQQSQSGAQANAMTQQKLQSSLEKAGFTDVTVVDAAYLVHAKTADGEQVLMSINPPVMGSDQSAANTGNSGSGSSGNRQQ